jgi:hypothetical protein
MISAEHFQGNLFFIVLSSENTSEASNSKVTGIHLGCNLVGNEYRLRYDIFCGCQIVYQLSSFFIGVLNVRIRQAIVSEKLRGVNDQVKQTSGGTRT